MDQPEAAIGDQILAYLAGKPPYEGDRRRPPPQDLHFQRRNGQLRFLRPVPELIFASVELLNADLVVGIKFERGLLYIEDSFGNSLSYQPLWVDVLVIALRRAHPRDNVPTTLDAPMED